MRQISPYSSAIEQQMQHYYGSLSEKDRRRYATIEAVKLGHGASAIFIDYWAVAVRAFAWESRRYQILRR